MYEEGPCLAVFKPGGLLTQAPPGIDSLEVRVKQFLKQRDQKPGNVYLGVPHRLDRPASGVLILARHVRAARRISEQFEGRTVEKIYWTLTEGQPECGQGRWEDWLRKVPGEARAEVVEAGHPEARQAVLHYRVLKRLDWGSWLEVKLETGRTHQIRVQLAFRQCPIIGDQQYGSQLPFGPASDDPRGRWIALHAQRLTFRHPMTHQRVEVSAPLPEAWQEYELAV